MKNIIAMLLVLVILPVAAAMAANHDMGEIKPWDQSRPPVVGASDGPMPTPLLTYEEVEHLWLALHSTWITTEQGELKLHICPEAYRGRVPVEIEATARIAAEDAGKSAWSFGRFVDSNPSPADLTSEWWEFAMNEALGGVMLDGLTLCGCRSGMCKYDPGLPDQVNECCPCDAVCSCQTAVYGKDGLLVDCQDPRADCNVVEHPRQSRIGKDPAAKSWQEWFGY